MFSKILIANRGEIAARIIRTVRRMGIASVAIWSDPDRFTLPVLAADEAVRVGPASARHSYLDIDSIIDACRETGADAVHPGYGFLSERPEFAERLEAEGISFIGPKAAHMRQFGLKHSAREIATASGVKLAPGSGLIASPDVAVQEALWIGYPIMLKSTAGGGGIGMQLCGTQEELLAQLDRVQRQGEASFGDARVYIEKFVADARHVEVQIFGDGKGGIVTLGERDCSLQRRNQKVVEETPAPGLSPRARDALAESARKLGEIVRYESAGTVEFIYDAATEEFYFLEVNTRLQVEHCVTEEVFGIDVVEWMIRQAAGNFSLPEQTALLAKGAAIEARIYAENPAQEFRPSTGRLTEVAFGTGARIETWVATGTEVTAHYDPLLAKIVCHGETREAARKNLARALDDTRLWGLETNLAYLRAVIRAQQFQDATMTTATLGGLSIEHRSIQVVSPGTQSSIQDWPGRLGYWNVGVPPSGPMDDRNFRIANMIVGNPPGAAALEMTLTGPALRFDTHTVIALAGASMQALLDGKELPPWRAHIVQAGQTLVIGSVEGPGKICYLAVRNGFDGPLFLGSRATFALGNFGGHATGVLRTGDVLHIAAEGAVADPVAELPIEKRPALTHAWGIDVLEGPHAAPEFFLPSDMEVFYAASYEVHYNSARTGIRLIGPKPQWARPDGGEAGLHPSNIHDNAYAIGAIDFTGDMPIILGPDGPSLGGFVCPAVVASDELWKLGQLRPADRVRFHRRRPPPIGRLADSGGAILLRMEGAVPVCYRRAGDSYLLVEYGAMALDIGIRLRVQLLFDALTQLAHPGVIDLTPGIRSLQVHYNPTMLPLHNLLEGLQRVEAALPASDEADIPSRIVHLPLSWNDEQIRLAMRRYQELVRPDAPWCPSNIEFIRRINGLSTIEEVRRIVFEASYLVLGLGDVYLGAPVATPLDPRHRLVTTKYNPARPWTPENAVGIGGAYLCVYGMEGPGGYQLFGRTIQMWNSWRRTDVFQQHTLLRYFDQIRFFPVSEDELAEARAAFPHGQYKIEIEETRFRAADHARFLKENAVEIERFHYNRQNAFEAERQRWVADGLDRFETDVDAPDDRIATILPSGYVSIDSPVPGNVWKVLIGEGDQVAKGDTLMIIESMKTEIRVVANEAGEVSELICIPGREIRSGQRVAVLRRTTEP